MNIVIVGYGGMGRYHFERLKKIDAITVTGMYDTDTKRCETGRADGLRVYNDYKEIAADSDIDAVLIATPNDFHAFYIDFFTKAKKKVLCEKPVVNSEAEFIKLLEKTGKGSLFTVNQNRRQDADFLTAKKIIQSGIIGKVYRIESRVTGANGVPGGWRKIKSQGGGMMLDWGVHLIDQICRIYDKITAVSCIYSYALGFDVEDGFLLNFTLPGGAHIIIEVQTNDFIGVPRWKLFGENGSAVIENWNLDGRITVPVYSGKFENVAINAGNGLTKTMAYRMHDTVKNLPLPKVFPDFDCIYNNFATAESDGEFSVKKAEVLRVLKIMDLCKKSAREGGLLITDKEGF